nr:4'-phosphopantetheinyl transferase superfamily protein [Streptomyces sp. NBC_00830]WTB35759.1 4'-phosphopantetheinyl transferase superfamily protein [Streptomyces sp. NBC_00830]
MTAGLFAPPVEFADAFGDPPGGAPAFPQEEAVVAGAVDKRRREFATVRVCARAALTRLGVAPAPILPGPGGAPGWPGGIVGAMSHCDGYRAAAVARTRDAVAIGLDAEPNEPLPHGVLDAVTLAPEREQLSGLAAEHPEVSWDRLIFSAKETVYKVWFPLTGRRLGFDEALITIHPRAGTFHARLLVPGPVVAGTRTAGFQGTWQAGEGLVRTAITLTPEQPGGWAAAPGSAESLGPLGPGDK